MKFFAVVDCGLRYRQVLYHHFWMKSSILGKMSKAAKRNAGVVDKGLQFFGENAAQCSFSCSDRGRNDAGKAG